VNPSGNFGAALDASPEAGLGILIVLSTARALGRLPDEMASIAGTLRWLRQAHAAGVPAPNITRVERLIP